MRSYIVDWEVRQESLWNTTNNFSSLVFSQSGILCSDIFDIFVHICFH